jgi:hypothetical protein
MLVVMLCTFYRAVIADLCADQRHCLRLGAADAEHLGSSVTDGGTLHIELDAPCHHLHMLFSEAGACTMITDGGTAQACFYAGFISMITGHNGWFIWLYL